MCEESILVPYKKSNLMGDIRRSVRVLQEYHGELGTVLLVRGYPEQVARLKNKITGQIG